jgi:hypothetical protein
MSLGFDRAIAQAMEDAGLGTYGTGPSDNIRVGESQPTPKEALEFTVVLEGGAPPVNVVGENLGFTVQTRHPSYETAVEQAYLVHRLFQEYQGNPRGVPIARIISNFPPTPVGRDTEAVGGRWRVTETFSALTRVVPFT